jgi:hypothetical protein
MELGMSRRSLVAALAGVVVVVGVLALALMLTRSHTTVIDADQARAAATTSITSSSVVTATTLVGGTPTAPQTGGDVVVYVYAMSGHEEIDALAGAKHQYPPETYLTIRSGGCGQMWRWQAIEERWSAWEVCDPQYVTVAGFDSFNKWFGVEDLQHYRCDGPAPYLPPTPDTDTWTFVCSTDSIQQATTAEVVGMETIDVGGEPVDTVHIHYVDTLSGDSTGGSETDRWVRPGDPLVIKEAGSTASASTSPIGTVNYTEEYEISIESLDALTQ